MLEFRSRNSNIYNQRVRVIPRLLMQVERNLEINHMQTVTKDVVETARESLVLGQA